MKNKKYHSSEQLQNYNKNNRENMIDNSNTRCFFTLIWAWMSYWIVSSFSFISLPSLTNIIDR